MCIYYTEKPGLTYGSGEHIIPAGFGGKAKLPIEFVSKEFNNDFSRLERFFMKDSIYAIIRQIVGPGSRGRMGVRYESTSKVHLVEDYPQTGNFSLGYIKKGKPKLIPQFHFNTQTKELGYDMDNTIPVDITEEIEKFAFVCQNTQDLKIKLETDERIPINLYYFGYQPTIEGNFDAYFFKHPQSPLTPQELPFLEIANALRTNPREPQMTQNKIHSKQTLMWKEEWYRVIGKICFNFLASINDKQFMLDPAFDAVRQYIAYGGENHFGGFYTGQQEFLNHAGIQLPNYVHYILLLKVEQELYGICNLYKSYAFQIKLTDQAPDNLPLCDGFICDWQNQAEYRLNEFLAKHIQ